MGGRVVLVDIDRTGLLLPASSLNFSLSLFFPSFPCAFPLLVSRPTRSLSHSHTLSSSPLSKMSSEEEPRTQSPSTQKTHNEEEIKFLAGRCNCNAIRISVPASSFPTYCALCHCLNCRASSGSLFVHLLFNFGFGFIMGWELIFISSFIFE